MSTDKHSYGNVLLVTTALCVISFLVYIFFFETNNIDVEEMTKYINIGDVPF